MVGTINPDDIISSDLGSKTTTNNRTATRVISATGLGQWIGFLPSHI